MVNDLYHFSRLCLLQTDASTLLMSVVYQACKLRDASLLVLLALVVCLCTLETQVRSKSAPSRTSFVGDRIWKLPANTRVSIRPISNLSECLTVGGSLSTIILKMAPCVDSKGNSSESNLAALSQCFVFIPSSNSTFRIGSCLSPHISVITPSTEPLTNRISNRARVSLMDWEDLTEQRWRLEHVHPCAAIQYGVLETSILENKDIGRPSGLECPECSLPAFTNVAFPPWRWRKFASYFDRLLNWRPAGATVTSSPYNERSVETNPCNSCSSLTKRHLDLVSVVNVTAAPVEDEVSPSSTNSTEIIALKKKAWIVRFNNARKLVPPLAPIGQFIPLLNERPAFKTFNAYLCWTTLTTFTPPSVHYITKTCKGEPRPDKVAKEKPRKAIWNWDAHEENRNKGRSLWMVELQ